MNLYQEAESKGIGIYRGEIPKSKGIAIPGNVCLDSGLVFDGVEERTVLAHDLGHVVTGSFYSRADPAFIRRRMENRADKWAIKKLVPLDELRAAFKDGRTEIWELADYFQVTEEMMRKALCWYMKGSLSLDYFGLL